MNDKILRTRGLMAGPQVVADGDGREIELSFSSDSPVPMGDVVEILSHDPEAVDLSRLNSGAAVLVEHDRTKLVGTVVKAWVENGKGRARVKLSRSRLGQEVLQDIIDGVRQLMSVGYHSLKATRDAAGRRLVTRWQPLELSFVSVPADASVGIGRSRAYSNPTTQENNEKMNKCKNLTEEIGSLRRQLDEINTRDLGDDAEFLRTATEKLLAGKEQELRIEKARLSEEARLASFNIGNSAPAEYSLLRAIRCATSGRIDGIEGEYNREVELKGGRAAAGLFIPLTAFGERAMSATGGTSGQYGGALVPTTTTGFIDVLRNRMACARLGATVLTGLNGNLSVPRQVAASSASWKTEVASLDEVTPQITSMDLSPKRVGAYTVVSKQLIVQTDNSVERLVRNDLMEAVALALDAAAINGSGESGQPEGILNTTGIGTVIGGTNGAAPDLADVVNLLQEVTIDNVDETRLGWLTNAKVRAKLQKTAAVSSTDSVMVWDKALTLPGQWAISNQVPSNLDKGASTGVCSAIIAGDFSFLVLATFGQAADLVVDPYTNAVNGQTRLICNFYCDVGIRRAEAFAAMKDALTA